MSRHGVQVPRGSNPPVSHYGGFGRFGRMFPDLYPFHAPEAALVALGAKGGPMDEGTADAKPADSKRIPAGFIFFGQFVDHDVTLDTTSSLERQNDPAAIWNFRTPFLELDNVYGLGPDSQPYLYDQTAPHKLLLQAAGGGKPRDLQRNAQCRAIIGDPRNDENILIAQIQYAMIAFHNAVVDRVANGLPDAQVFREAQRLVRWHYQYIVVNELLPLICGDEVVADVLANGRKLYRPEDSPDYAGDPYIPVEFSVAAYRYGHSQVRSKFKLNAGHETTLFGLLGSAFRPLEPGEVVEWKRFFEIGGSKPQPARNIDTLLPTVLLELPFTNDPDPARNSLAVRNLLRGKSFCLPSGQTIARFLCNRCDPAPRIYSQAELGLADYPALEEAPLWYYLLKEAAIETKGAHLGRLGGRIVAEVLLGLLELDPMSYLHLYPCWEPELTAVAGLEGGGKGKGAGKGKGGRKGGPHPGKPKFTFGDLLQIAGVA